MPSLQVRVPMVTILPRIQRKPAAAADGLKGSERPHADASRLGGGGGLMRAASAGSVLVGGSGSLAEQLQGGARDGSAAAMPEVEDTDEDADAMSEACTAHSGAQ